MGNCLGGGGVGGAAALTHSPPPAAVAPAAAPTPQPSLPPPPDRPMPTFDEERLRELSTVVDLRDTLLGFIKHGRALVEEVAASCTESAEDCTSRTAKAAHALKGAAKTIGASRLAHSAEIIELRAKQGESCGSYVPDLSAAYEDLATGVSQRTWS
ncbi:Hypothetical protein NocV09_01700070 [Nannochloropsis oceanica]